jgi:hypothetical protein
MALPAETEKFNMRVELVQVEEICSWVFGRYQGYRFRRKIGGRNSLKQER